MTFFDRQDGYYVEFDTPGVQDHWITTLRYHRHYAVRTTIDLGFRRWECDECDAFAWKPSP